MVGSVGGGFESLSGPVLVTSGHSPPDQLNIEWDHAHKTFITVCGIHQWSASGGDGGGGGDVTPNIITINPCPVRHPGGGPSEPPTCSRPPTQGLIHKPLKKTWFSLLLLSLLQSQYPPLTKQPFPQNCLCFRISLPSGSFCGIYTLWKGQAFFPRTWTVPTTVPNNPSAGKSRRGVLGVVRCPLELLSWSVILYCMTLRGVLSSHSCEGPSCQETDTERNNVEPRTLRLQLKSWRRQCFYLEPQGLASRPPYTTFSPSYALSASSCLPMSCQLTRLWKKGQKVCPIGLWLGVRALGSVLDSASDELWELRQSVDFFWAFIWKWLD